MAGNIGDIRSIVSSRIKDAAANLTLTPLTGDVDRAIIAAKEQYEKARPRELTIKAAGDGGFRYSLPGDFKDGFSIVKEVVFPYNTTDREPSALDPDDWAVRRYDVADGGLKLVFITASPQASELYAVVITTPHTLDAGTSTVPATDDEALAALGASFCCDKLAALYSQDTESSITADTMDRLTKAQAYRSQAKAFKAEYDAKMSAAGGEGGQAVAAAAAVSEIDTRFPNTQRDDRFFHGRRFF